MSLYKQYVEEREPHYHVHETDKGYAKYKLFTDSEGCAICYLEDIYVVPESRKSGVATAIAKEVEKRAVDFGAQVIFGSVCLNMNNATDSLKVVLADGYRLSHLDPDKNMIFLRKNL